MAEAIVENPLAILVNFFGNPVSIQWKGMLVDADRKIVGTYSRHGDDRSCDFLRIGGAHGSAQEHRLFERSFSAELYLAVAPNPV